MTGRRFHTLSVLSVILGLLIFFTDLSRFSYVRELAKFVNMLTAPILEFKDRTVSELKEELGAYIKNVEVEKENIKLRRRLRSLLLAEKELSACLGELEKLSEKKGIKVPLRKLDYSLSRIIYYDPSGFDLFLIIEGGKDRNFNEGDLVVSENNVIGIVESVFGSTSRVITPFNERFSSSAIVGKSPKKYIYKGGFPEGRLLHVNVEDRIKKGAEVFLVTLKDKIPPFLIGRVEKISRGKDPFFKEVKVKPAVDSRKEEYVFVIRGRR